VPFYVGNDILVNMHRRHDAPFHCDSRASRLDCIECIKCKSTIRTLRCRRQGL